MAAIALAPPMMGPILEEVQIMVRMVPKLDGTLHVTPRAVEV